MTLTDTHCHLDFEQFDEDREAVIQRARDVGVLRILIPALNLKSSLAVVLLAQNHPNLFAAIGVHPGEAGSWDAGTLPALRELADPSHPDPTPSEAGARGEDENKIVAIGEIGLDYYWDAAARELQKSVLKEQLEFAAEKKKPVIIHLREKDDNEHGACAEDLMKILEDWVTGLKARKDALAERPGVLHSFSGSKATAEWAMRLGFYIGVTGPVTYKNAGERRQIIADISLDRLLVETDAPFLAPVPRRGKRNEPAFVRFIADKIGEIHSKHPEEVAALTSANAARLFHWGD